jgi:hypothetical protein
MTSFNRELALAVYFESISMSLPVLEEAVGGLSRPSKMPWLSYSLPATRCKVGSRLRSVAGSTCAACYACKGRYTFRNVQDALTRRMEAVDSGLSRWAGVMAALLDNKSRGHAKHFRWHDSGDIQSSDHLEAIAWIARTLPHIRFWLPTKEYGIARRAVGTLPANLTVRVSAAMVGENGPQIEGLPVATVGRPAADAYACPAYGNGGKCGDCRACWDRGVAVVDYPLH